MKTLKGNEVVIRSSRDETEIRTIRSDGEWVLTFDRENAALLVEAISASFVEADNEKKRPRKVRL